MVIWIILAVVIGLIAVYCVTVYNVLVKKRNTCEEAFSTMDVYLKQRWDYVPNLVETVKGYMKHEAETLEKIISLRTNSYDSMSTEEKINANNELSRGLGRLLAVSEAYPDLKSSANFQDLSNKLEAMEGHIANSRKYYNGAVKSYNTTIQVFPNVIFAKMFGFKTMKMFEINAAERENVKVKF